MKKKLRIWMNRRSKMQIIALPSASQAYASVTVRLDLEKPEPIDTENVSFETPLTLPLSSTMILGIAGPHS